MNEKEKERLKVKFEVKEKDKNKNAEVNVDKSKKTSSFWSDNRGVNTIEIVIILAVVVGIALIFRDQMITFAGDILEDVLSTETDVSPETIRNEGKRNNG